MNHVLDEWIILVMTLTLFNPPKIRNCLNSNTPHPRKREKKCPQCSFAVTPKGSTYACTLFRPIFANFRLKDFILKASLNLLNLVKTTKASLIQLRNSYI